MKITTTQALELIEATQPDKSKMGKLFKVAFTKRTDGSKREMKARLGIQRNLTGNGMSYDASKRNLKTVWSADSQGYRNIPLEGLNTLTIGSDTYEVC